MAKKTPKIVVYAFPGLCWVTLLGKYGSSLHVRNREGRGTWHRKRDALLVANRWGKQLGLPVEVED